MSAQINVARQCVEVVFTDEAGRYAGTIYRDNLSQAEQAVEDRHATIVDIDTLPF